jgi:hypothetical protein
MSIYKCRSLNLQIFNLSCPGKILGSIAKDAKYAKYAKDNMAPFASFAAFAILPEKARYLMILQENIKVHQATVIFKSSNLQI